MDRSNELKDSSLLPLLYLSGKKSWEMPQLPSLNKLPPCATLIPYPLTNEARSLEREKSPWFISLIGQWNIKIEPRPEDVTLAKLEADDWSPIVVPGN